MSDEPDLPTDGELRDRYDTCIIPRRRGTDSHMHIPVEPNGDPDDVRTLCGLPTDRCRQNHGRKRGATVVTLRRNDVAAFPPGYLQGGWCKKCKAVEVTGSISVLKRDRYGDSQ